MKVYYLRSKIIRANGKVVIQYKKKHKIGIMERKRFTVAFDRLLKVKLMLTSPPQWLEIGENKR